MKILVISQYFPPEPGATSNRLLSFVEAMVKRGHDVTVICEFPNHPIGILSPEDKWRLYRVEDNGSYKVVRTFVMTFAKKNNIKRMLFYLSFAFSSFVATLLLRRHDVIFASSPPIFHAFTSMVAAKIKRSKFVVDIRDLWPDTALVFEAVSNKYLLKWGGYIEKKIYQNSDIIFTVSQGIRKKIMERGGKGKAYISYNGSTDLILNWHEDVDSFRKSQNWSGKIIIMYAGIIGLGQNLSILIPHILNLNIDNLLFIFKGDGPGKAELNAEIAKYNLANVLVSDTITSSEILPYLHSADILMVILRENRFFKSAIPSKFFDYMAAGKPIISNVDGELREIMESNKTGIYFSLNKPGTFKKAIETLVNNPEKRILYGENGKKLVENNFLRSKLSDQLAKIIEENIKC